MKKLTQNTALTKINHKIYVQENRQVFAENR
jgi:hypothetical protein